MASWILHKFDIYNQNSVCTSSLCESRVIGRAGGSKFYHLSAVYSEGIGSFYIWRHVTFSWIGTYLYEEKNSVRSTKYTTTCCTGRLVSIFSFTCPSPQPFSPFNILIILISTIQSFMTFYSEHYLFSSISIFQLCGFKETYEMLSGPCMSILFSIVTLLLTAQIE